MGARSEFESYWSSRGINPTTIRTEELLDHLHPEYLLTEIATGIQQLRSHPKVRALEHPVNLDSLLGELVEHLNFAVASRHGHFHMVSASEVGGASLSSAVGGNPSADTSSATLSPLVSIRVVWRDLVSELWPKLLEEIPPTLEDGLRSALKYIEVKSGGRIKADVHTKIQEAINKGKVAMTSFVLVIPAFIVPLFGEDPKYKENINLMGRLLLLGVPIAGRPIIKSPGGMALTAEPLFTTEGWKRFQQDLKKYEQLGVDIAQGLAEDIAKGIVDNAVGSLARAVAGETRYFTWWIPSFITNAVDNPAFNTVGRLLGDYLFNPIAKFLQSVVDALQKAGSTLESVPLPLTEVVEQLYKLIKGKNISIYEELHKFFGKELADFVDKMHLAGFITIVDTPKGEKWPDGLKYELGKGYTDSTVIKLKDMERWVPKRGRVEIQPGTVLVFRGVFGDEYREVKQIRSYKVKEDGREKSYKVVELSKSPKTKHGLVKGGGVTVSPGNLVMVVYDKKALDNIEFLNVVTTFHTVLQYAQDHVESLVSGQIAELFKGLREEITSTDPNAHPNLMQKNVSSKIDTAFRDTLAKLAGASDFEALKEGKISHVVRALPVTGASVSVSGNEAEWIIPHGGFTQADVNLVLVVENAKNKENDGEHKIINVKNKTQVITEKGKIVNETFGANVAIRLTYSEKLNSPEVLGKSLTELQAEGIEAAEKLVSKGLEKGIKKVLEWSGYDIDKISKKVNEELKKGNVELGQTVSQLLSNTASKVGKDLAKHMGLVEIFRIDKALIKYANSALFGVRYEKLPKLPSNVSFPDSIPADLKNKINYDDGELSFMGAMSDDEQKKLLKLSDDKDYQEAIKKLHKKSNEKNPDELNLMARVEELGRAAVMEIAARAVIVSVVCGFEITGGRAKEGAGVYLDWTTNLFLFNKITGNRASGSGMGGGVMVRGYLPNIFIMNDITKNTADDCGGGVFVKDGLAVFVLNNIGENSSNNGKGGGICLSEGSVALLAWNDISKNKAKEGGGLYINSETALLCGNQVSDNEAKGSGGGASIIRDPLLIGNKFSGNIAEDGGGVSFVGGSSATMIENYISSNKAHNSGGGYAVLDGANPDVSGDRVANRNDAKVGGGIFIGGSSKPSLAGIRVSNNTASENGGGIYIEAGTTTLPEIVASTFLGNKAPNGQGGGIWIGRDAIFAGLSVGGNQAKEGAGVYAEAIDSLEFYGCTFNGNIATSRGGGGALLHVKHARFFTSELQHNFLKSFAVSIGMKNIGSGAGLYVEGASLLNISQSLLKENYLKGGSGAGVAAFECDTVQISETSFLGNATEYQRGFTARGKAENYFGGGLFVVKCNSVQVRDCSFKRNGAERGGGIAALNCSTTSVMQSVFKQNVADLNRDGYGLGGAIYCKGRATNIQIGGDHKAQEGNAFMGNTAGTPLRYRLKRYANPSTVEGSGGAVAVEDGSTAIIEGNLWEDNAATDLGGAILLRDTGPNSRIGGENDPDTAEQRWGNVGRRNCAVIRETTSICSMSSVAPSGRTEPIKRRADLSERDSVHRGGEGPSESIIPHGGERGVSSVGHTESFGEPNETRWLRESLEREGVISRGLTPEEYKEYLERHPELLGEFPEARFGGEPFGSEGLNPYEGMREEFPRSYHESFGETAEARHLSEYSGHESEAPGERVFEEYPGGTHVPTERFSRPEEPLEFPEPPITPEIPEVSIPPDECKPEDFIKFTDATFKLVTPSHDRRRIIWLSIVPALVKVVDLLNEKYLLAPSSSKPAIKAATEKVNKLKDPIYTEWPAEAGVRSGWSSEYAGSSVVPPWYDIAGWIPGNFIDLTEYDFKDAVLNIKLPPRKKDPTIEIITKRGGFFAIVRGEGTEVYGNWIQRNYSTQFGGGGYITESDSATIIGKPSSKLANHFRANLSTLGGALALNDGTAVRVVNNDIGGEKAYANIAAAGGGIFIHKSIPNVENNRIIANVAGYGINPLDWNFLPEEMSNWAKRGLMAFGGGLVVAGRAKQNLVPHILGNEVKENVVLGIPFLPVAGATASGEYSRLYSIVKESDDFYRARFDSDELEVMKEIPSAIRAALGVEAAEELSKVSLDQLRGIFHLPPDEPTPEQLSIEDGTYIFGGGVALLEAGKMMFNGNIVQHNEVILSPERARGGRIILAGGGISIVLVDVSQGEHARIYDNKISENCIRIPHKGIAEQVDVNALGGGVGVISSHGIKIVANELKHNVVEHEIPDGDVPTPELRGVLFGGGMGVISSAEVEAEKNQIIENALFGLDAPLKAAGGGIGLFYSFAILSHNLVVGNFSHRDGGGLAVYGGRIIVNHVTFADNDATSRGSAIFLDKDLRLSVFRRNLIQAMTPWNGAAIFGGPGLSVPVFVENNVWTGTGKRTAGAIADFKDLMKNISVHPGFADPNKRDYALLVGSPSRDAVTGGADFGWSPTTTTLPGQFRTLKVKSGQKISDAVKKAKPGEIVLVGPGTYVEAEPLKLAAGVIVRSEEGADKTFLKLVDGSTEKVLVKGEDSAEQTVFSGFTLDGAGVAEVGIELNSQFQGYILDNIIIGTQIGIDIKPKSTITNHDRYLGYRAWIANNTIVGRNRGVGVRFISFGEKQDASPIGRPCRIKEPPSVHTKFLETGNPVIEHNIIYGWNIGMMAQKLQQPPVTSRFVVRNDLYKNSTHVEGFVSDLLIPGLNDNIEDEPFLLLSPPPQRPLKPSEKYHPIADTGSRILGGKWPDGRTFGAVVSLPRPSSTQPT